MHYDNRTQLIIGAVQTKMKMKIQKQIKIYMQCYRGEKILIVKKFTTIHLQMYRLHLNSNIYTDITLKCYL